MSATKPHVAYVSADRGIPILGTKGASTHIREFVNALARRGAEIRVLSPRPTDGASRAGIRAQIIDVGSGPFLGALRNRIRRGTRSHAAEVLGNEALGLLLNHELYHGLQRLHSRWGIEVVYERYSLWGYAGLRFARDRRIPFVLEVNAPLRLEQTQYRALRNAATAEAIEGELLSLADLVLVPSSALRDYVRGRGAQPGRVRVVVNAADHHFLRPAPRPRRPASSTDSFVIGFVGSLKPWHGIQDLLRAFVRLHRRHPSYRLLIVGNGPLRPAIDAVRRANNLDDAMIVTGSVDYADMPGLLRQMDVGVAPYPRLPGFYFSPLKIYEYMAAGVPIVASAIGQISEVLPHRKVALLHPPGRITLMMKHIEELRRRPMLRLRLAREARRLVVKRFTWDRNAARVLAMVQRLRRHTRDGQHGPAHEPAV